MGKPIPKQDHKVSKQAAKEFAKRYRDKARKKEKLPDMPPLGFHRSAYDRILSQPGCEAIRSYPALHEDGTATMVLVGVDAEGNDMVDGALMQISVTCPPYCSDPNELNSDP